MDKRLINQNKIIEDIKNKLKDDFDKKLNDMKNNLFNEIYKQNEIIKNQKIIVEE